MHGRQHLIAVALCSATTVLACRADAQATGRALGRELGDAGEDVGFVLRSPLRAGSEDWLNVAFVGAGFGALSTLDGSIDRWIVDHPSAVVLDIVKPFRETNRVLSKLVTGYGLLPISVGLITAGMIGDDPGLRDAGAGCLSGWAVSNAVRYAVYFGVSRQRPYVANGDQYGFAVPGGRDWDGHSFPAGHTTNAFACTTFWNERFDLGAAEPVLYVMSAASALARMADRRHWASDTFIGATMGYALGRSLARRSAHRHAQREIVAGARRLRAGASDRVLILWRRSF